MFRIMKIYVCEKNRLCTFSITSWASKVHISWAWKNFERNSFSSSQWIESQEMIRIMKKDACEAYVKIGAKKSLKFINRTWKKKSNQHYTRNSWLEFESIAFHPGPRGGRSWEGWGLRGRSLLRKWEHRGPIQPITEKNVTNCFFLRFRWKFDSYDFFIIPTIFWTFLHISKKNRNHVFS